jgi:hypothetical protein
MEKRWKVGGTATASVCNTHCMATLTHADSHAATARLDIHEIVRQLNAHLGTTLVAASTGTKDRGLPLKWAKPDGPMPREEAQRRILFLHRVWRQLAEAESDHVARSWMIGGNPLLDEDTPVTAIREDRYKEVAAAVTAFLEDSPAT